MTGKNKKLFKGVTFLCPFAVYYLRYAVMAFFTISRMSLADGKRAGLKVHRKITVAEQNVKFKGSKKSWPLKMSLEMAHKVVVPQKKIMSRSFLNSGTLTVIRYHLARLDLYESGTIG